jgi:hypothetical protein
LGVFRRQSRENGAVTLRPSRADDTAGSPPAFRLPLSFAQVHTAHGETGITARLEPAAIDRLVYASSMVRCTAASIIS